MVATLRSLWAHHKLLLIGFTSALALTLFFGIKAIFFALYWNDPAHRNQTVEGWMTIRYVAQSWRVPPHVVRDALPPLPAPDGPPVRMQDIAEAQSVSIEELGDRLTTAIAAHIATQVPK